MLLFLIQSDDYEERWKWLLSKLGDKEMSILYQEAYAILDNKEDAYDVLHNALLKGFSKCDQLRDDSKAFYWKLRIVRNEAYAYYKRFSMNTIIVQTKLVLAKPSYSDSSEYLVIQKQENARLRKAMGLLKNQEKEILHMRIFEDKGFPEIAEKMKMNYHTVRSQYRRTLKKLKRSLEGKKYE